MISVVSGVIRWIRVGVVAYPRQISLRRRGVPAPITLGRYPATRGVSTDRASGVEVRDNHDTNPLNHPETAPITLNRTLLCQSFLENADGVDPLRTILPGEGRYRYYSGFFRRL